MDVAASCLAELTFGDAGPLSYFHIENPTSTPWSTIAHGISQHNGADLPLIPFSNWLSKLSERGAEDVDKVPAVRLLDFLEHMEPFPALSVKNTLAIAPKVDFGLITGDLLARYLTYQAPGAGEA